jgi:hypothetical protein
VLVVVLNIVWFRSNPSSAHVKDLNRYSLL